MITWNDHKVTANQYAKAVIDMYLDGPFEWFAETDHKLTETEVQKVKDSMSKHITSIRKRLRLDTLQNATNGDTG